MSQSFWYFTIDVNILIRLTFLTLLLFKSFWDLRCRLIFRRYNSLHGGKIFLVWLNLLKLISFASSEKWECVRNVLGDINCIENRWSMFSMARNCSSRLVRPITLSEQKSLVLCHWRLVVVIYDRKMSHSKLISTSAEFLHLLKVL